MSPLSDSPTHIFLSFIGLGRVIPHPEQRNQIVDAVYDPTAYYLHDPSQPLEARRYVQSAIVDLEARQGIRFDQLLLAMTPDSRRWHWEQEGRLRSELPEWAIARAQPLDIDDALNVAAQWSNFGKILEAIPEGAVLSVDLTHGFRAIPILFSVAIELLVRVKHVTLRAAYYGAYEPRKSGPFPIVEMSGFFSVNRWAEAVRAVTEDANPSLLSQLAAEPGALQVGEIADPELLDGLDDLAGVIKNANSVAVVAASERVIRAVERLRAQAGPISRPLLQLLEDKFSSLVQAGSEQQFTPAWYHTQLAFAQTLLGHGLLMQGLTVLQELIISWCEEACAWELANPNNPGRLAYLQRRKFSDYKKKCREQRRGFGDSLRARLALAEGKWKAETSFDPTGELVSGIVGAVYDAHFVARHRDGEFAFFGMLGELRNTLNHAWVGRKPLAKEEVAAQVATVFAQASAVTGALLVQGVIGRGAPVLVAP